MKSSELFDKLSEILTEGDSLKECLDASILLLASVIAQGSEDMDAVAMRIVFDNLKTAIPELRAVNGSTTIQAMENVQIISEKLCDPTVSIDQIIDEHIKCNSPEIRATLVKELETMREQRLNQTKA